MSAEDAAATLEHMDPDAAATQLAAMSVEDKAATLANMSNDAKADALTHMSEEVFGPKLRALCGSAVAWGGTGGTSDCISSLILTPLGTCDCSSRQHAISTLHMPNE